jgi:flagellar biosynthesis/type III secretory pathway protein FliH
MQTFIDRYIEQGRQQGWQKGRQEGRQEGWQEGRQEGRQEGGANILLRLIEQKFGPPSESVRARIASADPETLLSWSERILSADSLDAVLH